MAQQPLMGQSLLSVQVSLHSHSPHSVGRVISPTSWQHTTLTTDKHPFKTTKPATIDRRPRGHWDRCY